MRMLRRMFLAGVPTAGLVAASIHGRTTSLPLRERAKIVGGFVHHGASSIYVRDWGAGPPLLFLSAWGFCSEAWQYQMLPLQEEGFRCVAYDRRGHGRSTDPGRGYDFDTLADDLALLIDALDLRDATLVAHSMGCGEAVRYLSRHGRQRIARLVLLAPITPFLLKTHDNPEGIDAGIFAAGRAKLSKDFPAALESGFPAFVQEGVSRELVAWMKGLMTRCSLKALKDCQEAFASTDFRDDLRGLRLPVLVIQGDADRSAPPDLTGRRTAAMIQGAELRIYPGAPHGFIFTHAARVNEDIAAFVRAPASA